MKTCVQICSKCCHLHERFYKESKPDTLKGYLAGENNDILPTDKYYMKIGGKELSEQEGNK